MTRKTYEELAEEVHVASLQYHGQTVQHVASETQYRIIGVHHREKDMAVCVEYTPIGKFYNQVKFARSIAEMDFGNRFVSVWKQP